MFSPSSDSSGRQSADQAVSDRLGTLAKQVAAQMSNGLSQ